MIDSKSTLCLDKFYPERDLRITDIKQQKDQILIQMKSISKDCRCPKCNCLTDKYHGTYHRKMDIPFKMNTLFGNSEHPFPERQCIAFRSRVQLFFN